MNLCVFQGTFNPIHNLHLKIIDFINQNYNFDKILVIPAYIPPHKNADNALAQHRLEMVKLSLQNNPSCEISTIEFERNQTSYTYKTISELYKQYEITDKINFVIGSDAFLKIETWYEIDKLKKLVNFLVIGRGNDFNKKALDFLKEKGFNYKYCGINLEDISSSYIRKLIKEKKDISKYVTENVRKYIKQHGLYE